MRFDGAQIVLGFASLMFFIGFVGACITIGIGGRARTEENGAGFVAGFCGVAAFMLLVFALITAMNNAKSHDARRALSERGYRYESVEGVRGARPGRVTLRVGACGLKVALNDDHRPVLYRDGQDVVLSPRDVERLGEVTPGCAPSPEETKEGKR